MTDGLYQATTPYLCAGFVIEDGRVAMCAPILRQRLSYWMKQAELVKELEEPVNPPAERKGQWKFYSTVIISAYSVLYH